MKLTIKTLVGATFELEVELSQTVQATKEKIATQEGEEKFPVELQKLIHAGKVLQNEELLSKYNIKEKDFLVCMVSKKGKAKKPAATAAAPAATASSSAPAPAAPAPATSAPNTSSASSSGTNTQTTVSTSESSNTTTSSASTVPAAAVDGEMDANVRNLCDMGFPEDQVRAALRAAFNNADRAVEYLMNGIPENLAAPASSSTPSSSGAATTTGGLEQLRNHPQFNQLRQMVQANPATLPQVLQTIGGQSPEMLSLIHNNQAAFVEMLNEPVTSEPAPSSSSAPPGAGAGAGMGGMDPAQLSQMFNSLPPAQQAQMAQSLGISQEQFQQVSQMMASMPPGALEQLLAGAGEGLGGGVPPGARQNSDGTTTISLTSEEMDAVNRLCEMGFNRNDSVQAYLACDKNEALAANFLMDSGSSMMLGDEGAADDNDNMYD